MTTLLPIVFPSKDLEQIEDDPDIEIVDDEPVDDSEESDEDVVVTT